MEKFGISMFFLCAVKRLIMINRIQTLKFLFT